MDRAKVRALLQLSYNDEARKYNDGYIEEADHKAFRFLWTRIAYRLSETDIKSSFVSRTFDKYGYEGCIERINKVRKHWGFNAIQL